MCPPVVAAAAAVVATVGTAVSGLQQASQMRYRGRVAEQNARLASDQARDAQERGRLDDRDTQWKTAQLMGQQRAAMAANGLDLGFGSALQVQADSAMFGQEDVRRVRENTTREMGGFDINATNFRADAIANRAAAKGQVIKTAFDTVGTALNGVSRYQNVKMDYNEYLKRMRQFDVNSDES